MTSTFFVHCWLDQTLPVQCKGSGKNTEKRVAWKMHMLHIATCVTVLHTSAEKFCYVAVLARMRAMTGARSNVLVRHSCLSDAGATGKKSEELGQESVCHLVQGCYMRMT